MFNRWLGKTIRFSTWLMAAILLTACGGGGGGGVGSGGFLGESDEPPYRMSITAYTPDGASANTLSAANPLTVEVRLVDLDNRAVPGESISLNADVGDVDPSNGSALTDDNGVATFTVSYNGTLGAGQLTATYNADEGDVTATLAVQSIDESSYLLELVTTDPSGEATRFFDANSPMTVIATLYRVNGQQLEPVQNATIEADTSIGVLSPDSGARLTDSAGRATFTIASDGTSGAGFVGVAFLTDNETIERTQAIEAVAGSSDFSLRLETLDPTGSDSRSITVDQPLTAIVTLEAVSDRVSVANQVVTLESDIAVITPESGRLLTNASGQAEFELSVGGVLGAGTVTASFETGGSTLSVSRNIETIAPELDRQLRITLTNQAGDVANTFDDQSPLRVQVAIVDDAGNVVDVDDEVVELTSTIGSITPSGGSTLSENGLANFTLAFDGSVGAGLVEARYATPLGFITATAVVEAVAEEVFTITLTPFSANFDRIITPDNPVYITVSVRSGLSGQPVNDGLVQFNSPISDSIPENGAVQTNGNGVAQIALTYNGSDGAGDVTASYTSPNGNTFTNSVVISSQRPRPDFELDILQPSGSTFSNETPLDIEVVLTSRGQAVANAPITLVSDVGVIRPDNATSLTDSAGTASFSLLGDGSTGAGVLTAVYTFEDVEYTDSITVQMLSADEEVNFERVSMTFVSAEPLNIALRGTGGGTGLEERSEVTFKLTDPSGNPVTGQEVRFELSTTLGGVEILNDVVVSNSNGEAVATIWAGALPTPVRVIAETEQSPIDNVDNPIRVLSDVLSISAGVATQGRFTLVAEVLNPPDAADVAGITSTLTAFAFDRFGNPVPNGTTVSFVSECGGVGQSEGTPSGSCRTTTGQCSVDWISQPSAARSCSDGRATILAYLLGEEDYFDNDSDGYYTVGDPNSSDVWIANDQDNPEPFLDADDQGDYDGGNNAEFFVDWNQDANWDNITPDANDPFAPGPKFNGAACVDDGDGNNGDYNTDLDCFNNLIYVFDSVVLVPGPSQSSDLVFGLTEFGGAAAASPLSPGSYQVSLSTADGNVPPLGTSITVTAEGECEVLGLNSTEVPNSNAEVPFLFNFTIIQGNGQPPNGVTIEWQTPNGQPAQRIYSCTP